MTDRIRRVGLVLLTSYGLLALAATYWQVARAEGLRRDPAATGKRIAAEEDRVHRGRILDRDGLVLAESVPGRDGTLVRRYSDPGAAHVVGYDSPRFGVAGAEAVGLEALQGRTGTSALQNFVADLLHRSREGEDLRLTLDSRIQRAAEAALGNASGAVVALDPRNGQLLALVSVPAFDPNLLTDEHFEALQRRPDSPMLNRATQGLYTPGSTFKTVTVAAALEARMFDARSPASCPARMMIGNFPVTSMNEPPGKSTRTAADAYAYSCNTFHAQLGLNLGRERFEAAFHAFGLNEAVPFDLPTIAGRISTTADYLASPQSLGVTAFGQGELQLTPLHLALIAAAAANGGEIPRPQLLLDAPSTTWRRALSPEAAAVLAQIMEYSAQQGWASSGSVPGVRVGGKTGTAETGGMGAPTHATYIGFAPVEAPRIAVAVVKEGAGAGSTEAAPVARAVIAAAAQR